MVMIFMLSCAPALFWLCHCFAIVQQVGDICRFVWQTRRAMAKSGLPPSPAPVPVPSARYYSRLEVKGNIPFAFISGIVYVSLHRMSQSTL
jgi:hypothetical protein